MTKHTLLLALLVTIQTSWSQTTLQIGQWKSHLTYKEGVSITQSDDKIIYASSKGLFTIDKEDLSVKFLAPENGLSGATASRVAFDSAEGVLFIIYADQNIDIIKDDEITNFPFIKSNTSIIGSKKINDIYFDKKGASFLATDFGLLIFNNKKLEFSSTTFTDDVKINCLSYDNATLFAGTSKGLFRIALDGSINVADFGAWQKIQVGGENANIEISHLATKHNRIYVSTIKDEVFSIDLAGDNAEEVYLATSNESIRYISDEGSDIMIGVEDNNRFISKTLFIAGDKSVQAGGADCVNRTLYAVEDQKGRVWYADQWDPVRYTEGKLFGCKKLSFSGPFNNSGGEIAFKDNKAYIASLGITEDYLYAFSNGGIYVYDDNSTWTNYNDNNVPAMAANEFKNVQAIAVHPDSSIVYVGSYWNGLLKYNTDTKEATHWNKANSLLQGVIGDETRTRVPYILFDDKKNLWISNFGAPKPLAVKTPEDKWYTFDVPSDKSLGDIAIDQNNNKWIAVVGPGNGLLAFNEGADLANKSDDKIRYISRSNSEITGNKINCVVVDLDGAVWVGTDAGPVVFDCGDPFKNECRGNIRKVVVDNIPAPLLKAEDILSIEVDGANRKWFGTRNGIFVQSPDGSEEVAQYNTSNSPLLENKIINLRFNPQSGEMFIVSPSGIQSLKTETTVGGRTHSSNVYAYPNPVRPEYNGLIAIKGLVRDANVKITDINGKLVYETTALGGQAVWDGSDYNGVKASAGVYLVFSSSTDISNDLDSFVTKILVVK
jgi:ligand-binding sensor domain-containing protein